MLAYGILTTTSWPVERSRALYASPIPPWPSVSRISYRSLSMWPGARRVPPICLALTRSPSRACSTTPQHTRKPTHARWTRLLLGRRGQDVHDLQAGIVRAAARQHAVHELAARLGGRAVADNFAELDVLQLGPQAIAAQDEPIAGGNRLAHEVWA